MCLPRRLAHDARLAIQQQAADFAGGQRDLFGVQEMFVSGTDRRGIGPCASACTPDTRVMLLAM